MIPGQSLGTLTPQTDLPISPSNSSTHASSDKCLSTPHHISVSSPLDIPTLSSSPPQADESDEHIAMLLEDMFMMGLNILPLVPLDRNLNEQDQLGPLQEQKGGQKGAEASTQGLFVQSCEPEMRESDVSKTATPVGSSGQRDEGKVFGSCYFRLRMCACIILCVFLFTYCLLTLLIVFSDHSGFHDQSRSNTVVRLTQSPEQDHLNQVQNLATASRNSTPSLIEGSSLIPKATAVPNSVATGEMPSLVVTSIPDDRPDFKLLQCLSPLESEKGDSDVPSKREPSEPSKPSHRQDSLTQNFPLWLSDSPAVLDFPLSSMIDISSPRPQHDLNACQNRSCPDLAEGQELKTSFSHNDLISGSSSNIIQPGMSDASERPKQRKTRKRRIATQKSKVKGDTECQNLENGDQVQPRISKCDEPHCGDIKPSNSGTYGVSTRMTSASTRIAAAMKRRREISSPLSKKMPLLDAASKQHLTGVVKRGRGRPPKSKTTPVAHLCNNFTSGQDDREVEKTKTDNRIEQSSKQEPNTQQEKDSTEMEEVDVNCNFAQATPNSHFKPAGQAKGPSILDQIFHQALSSVASPACNSSLNFNQQQTSSLRDSSFSLQRFQGEKNDDVNSKSVMNSSEQIKTGICGEKKAETSMLINEKKDVEVSDNHARSPLSCGDMPDNVKYSGKDGDISMEENSRRTATVLQNSDFQNEMGKDIQDHTTEISVLSTSEEDIMKDVMTPDEDMDDADHDFSPTKMDCVVTTNEPTVMEGIEMNFCLNPDITQAEHVKKDLKTTVSNERSFEMTSGSEKKVQAAHGVDTQDIDRLGDCLENNEKEDLGWNKDDQMIEETDVRRVHTFVEEHKGRWETTNGSDDDDIDVVGSQYSAEMFDGRTLLEEEELSQGHIASAKTADDPSKGGKIAKFTLLVIIINIPDPAVLSS